MLEKTTHQLDRTSTGSIDDFINSLDLKPTSRETYRKGIKQFLEFLQERGVGNPGEEDIIEFKRVLQERGLSPYTVNTYITAIRRLFQWTERKGFYRNIAQGIKGLRKSRGFKREVLTIHQIKELLNSIERNTLEGKRDYALINLLIRTGLRTIEVVRANVEDIKQVGGEAVLYVWGKGRDTKDEYVVLTPAVLKPLREYLAERKASPGEPLFTSTSNNNKNGRLTTRAVRGIIKKRLRAIGIEDNRLTAHSLRHTAITLSLLAGATIQEAQVLARHRNINTTLIYAHNINRINNAPERYIDKYLQGAGI